MRIGIIGAGHAGIEAAQVARQAGAAVTVFSAEEVLPYFRPRLVSVAMGQVAAEAIAMHPAAWYAERGIELRLAAPVTDLDVAGRAVCAGGRREAFDALILACGAMPVRPRLPDEQGASGMITLWSMAEALAIRARWPALRRIVVIGGASLGVESALRGREQQVQVVLVERLSRLFPLLLGTAAAGVVQRQLEERGVAVCTGQTLLGVTVDANGGRRVHLSDGTELEADLVLSCIGAAPNLALARQAGLPVARGILADACLQVAPGIFAAGDVCQVGERPARGAVREASAQGRLAGQNAAAFAGGAPLMPFVFSVVPMSVKCGGVEINAAGCPDGAGVAEECLGAGGGCGGFRVVTRRAADGRLTGVQMVGTREGFDALVAELGG
jgi:NAD(P)H-nitrite reductase large subunit